MSENTHDDTLFCTVHPDRETSLRCNNCNRPMCAQCAVQTPVGYRCRECVRGIQDKYFNASANDDLIAAGVSAGLTGLGAAIIAWIGLGLLFALLLALPVGGGVSEAVVRATGKRRSRNMAYFALGGALAGGLVGASLRAVLAYNDAVSRLPANAEIPIGLIEFVGRSLTGNWGTLVFVGVVTAVIYSRLRSRG